MSLLLSHSRIRQIAIDYINKSISSRDRANRVARTRVILDYLHHRKTRSILKKNGGFWGKNIPDYIDPVHSTTSVSSAASTLGRLGGKAKSPAKSISSRENGRKGGRPRNKDKGKEIESVNEANLDLYK